MLYDGAFSGWLMKRMGRTRYGEIEREGMGEGWSWQIVWGFFKTTVGDKWQQCLSFIISDPLFNQRQRKTATVQRTGLQDKVSSHHHSSPPLLTHTHTHIFSNTRLYPSNDPTHIDEIGEGSDPRLDVPSYPSGSKERAPSLQVPW